MASIFAEFQNTLLTDPVTLITFVLTASLIIINGLSVAPNNIVTCVTTRSLSLAKAVVLAAFFEFLGIFVMTAVNTGVAQTMFRLADFGSNEKPAALTLCAAMTATMAWSFTAWKAGIPTSESHALAASLAGSALGLSHSLSSINPFELAKIALGMFFSIVIGYYSGFIIQKATVISFRCMERKKASYLLVKGQIAAAASMSFMHGAQDGQKFMAVMLLSIALKNGEIEQAVFFVPIWVMLVCSCLMAVGTAIGARRIIRKIGMKMVHFEPYQGFAADAASSLCLFLSSMLSMPVSTAHTKTAAIMGVALARRRSFVNWGIVRDILMAWLATIPACMLLGYAAAAILLNLFL